METKGMSGKDYFSLAFGSMIGIGWVVSVPLWIANAGTFGAIMAMLVTTAVVIPIGFVYAELCTSLKVAGGEFAYTYLFLGRIPGFICGWFLILGYITILPWVALSVASLFSYMMPSLKSFPLYTVLGNTLYVPEMLIGLFMIWGLAFLNLRGIQASKMFQNIATGMMLLTFVVFFLGCFFFGNVGNLEPYYSDHGVFSGVMMAVASMLFFMNGFDTIPKASDEADKNINYTNLAKALVGTILVGGGLYVGIIISASLIMVPGSHVNLGSLPLIQAFQFVSGSWFLTLIIIFGVLMGVTTTFNGFLLAGSKLVLSFAEAGFISRRIDQTDSSNVPRRSILLLASISTVGMFMGKGLLAPLITMGGIAFLIAWFLMALSNAKFRQVQPDAQRPFKVPGGIYMIWGAILVSGALTLLMAVPGTLISLGMVENILLGVWSILGIVVYMACKAQPVVLKEIKK